MSTLTSDEEVTTRLTNELLDAFGALRKQLAKSDLDIEMKLAITEQPKLSKGKKS